MNEFLNIGFAWIAVAFSIILAIVYSTRKMIEKSASKSFWIRLNRSLRKYHKELGYLLIVVSALHGLLSSDELFSLNLGTYAWIFSILLALSYWLRKPLSHYQNWMKVHRYLTVFFLLFMLWHIVDVGSVVIDAFLPKTQTIAVLEVTQESNTENQTQNVNIEPSLYGNLKDVIYTGSATGYNPGLSVEIEIKNNLIQSIAVLDHNEERSRFYQPAIDEIPSLILASQSLDVDTITGSTFTSTGIINAVNDALSQALIDGSLPELLTLPAKRRH